MIVLILILIGFTFGLYYIQNSHDIDYEADGDVPWYTELRYLYVPPELALLSHACVSNRFVLTVGAADFKYDDEISAQLFTLLYIVFATILMMNLLSYWCTCLLCALDMSPFITG